MTLLVFSTATWHLRESRLAHEDHAATTTKNLAQTLGEGIALIFDRIDHALLAVSDEVLRQHALGKLDDDMINEFLLRWEKRLPSVSNLVMCDAQGNLTHGAAVKEHGTASIAHRDYFVQARDNPQTGLLISKPVNGRLTGIPQIILVRRINGSDGRFFGLVFAVIHLEQFTKQFAKLNLGFQGLVALRYQDASLIARYPSQEGDQGQPGAIAISPELMAIRANGQQDSTYMTNSPTDNIRRIYTYRAIQDTPLYLIVGMALQDSLSHWYKEVGYALVVIPFLLGLLGLALGKLNNSRRQEELTLADLLASTATRRSVPSLFSKWVAR